jgi:hypothetical protein
VLFTWSTSSPADTEVVPSAITNNQYLYLTPGTLNPGTSYTIQMRCENVDSPLVFTTAEIQVVTRNSDLVSRIAGGDRLVSQATASLVLDGTASHDPDGNPIDYAWSCRFLSNDGLCFSTAVADSIFDAVSLLEIDTSNLEVTDSAEAYVFTLTISDSTTMRSDTASVQVQVTAAPIPDVSITYEALYDTFPTSEKLRMNAVVDSGSYDFEWFCQEGDGLGFVNLTNADNINSIDHYRQHLTIRSDVLSVGTQYVFGIRARLKSSDGEWGVATFNILTNSPPLLGTCYPSESTLDFTEKFTFTCSGWIDAPEDQPSLQYAFAYLGDNGEEVMLSVFQSNNVFSCIVPIGEKTIRAFIRDPKNSITTFEFSVTSVLTEVDEGSILDQINDAESLGDYNLVTQLVLSMETLVSTESRRRRNGMRSLMSEESACDARSELVGVIEAQFASQWLDEGTLSSNLGVMTQLCLNSDPNELAEFRDSCSSFAQAALSSGIQDGVSISSSSATNALSLTLNSLGNSFTDATSSCSAGRRRSRRLLSEEQQLLHDNFKDAEQGSSFALVAGATVGETASTVDLDGYSLSSQMVDDEFIAGSSVNIGSSTIHITDVSAIGEDPVVMSAAECETSDSYPASADSSVLTLTMLDATSGAEIAVNDLDHPIMLVINHPAVNNTFERNCTFFDTASDTWRGEGCVFVNGSQTTATTTMCNCTHLTDFAILLEEKKARELSTPGVYVINETLTIEFNITDSQWDNVDAELIEKLTQGFVSAFEYKFPDYSHFSITINNVWLVGEWGNGVVIIVDYQVESEEEIGFDDSEIVIWLNDAATTGYIAHELSLLGVMVSDIDIETATDFGSTDPGEEYKNELLESDSYKVFGFIYFGVAIVSFVQFLRIVWAAGCWKYYLCSLEHFFMSIMCCFRAALCAIYFDPDTIRNMEFTVLTVLTSTPYLIMFWLFSFVIFAWSAIYHFASDKDKPPFDNVKWLYIGTNILASVITMILFICIDVLDDLDDVELVVKFASTFLSALCLIVSLCFLGYGYSLCKRLTADFPSQYAKKLYRVGVTLSICFMVQSFIYLLSAYGADVFVDNFDTWNSLYYSVDIVACGTILFLFKKSVADSVTKKKEASTAGSRSGGSRSGKGKSKGKSKSRRNYTKSKVTKKKAVAVQDDEDDDEDENRVVATAANPYDDDSDEDSDEGLGLPNPFADLEDEPKVVSSSDRPSSKYAFGEKDEEETKLVSSNETAKPDETEKKDPEFVVQESPNPDAVTAV